MINSSRLSRRKVGEDGGESTSSLRRLRCSVVVTRSRWERAVMLDLTCQGGRTCVCARMNMVWLGSEYWSSRSRSN